MTFESTFKKIIKTARFYRWREILPVLDQHTAAPCSCDGCPPPSMEV